MARQRRRPPSNTSSSSAYARRNERARAAGFRNYYEQRVAGTAAGSPERARARGHRGTEDLLRSLRPGTIVVVPEGLASIPKDAKGRYARIEVLVLREDGRADRFTIRRATYDRVTRILEQMAAQGAQFSPSPSLDLRRLVRVSDRPDDEEEDE